MMEIDEYQKAQQHEIELGKEEGLDVSIYSNPQFNWLQMEQIRVGLKDKLDAAAYADPSYNYDETDQAVPVFGNRFAALSETGICR